MKKNLPRDTCLNRRVIALAVASCFAPHLALANPTAPTVVHGSAAFQQHGNLLQITNSPNAIIHWGSFSIGASEITRFVQQSASSAVLNRVVGQDPSSILGALQSNGRVFLVNPNGILFGAGAQIDVAGLVASTLNLSNADFLTGRLNFTEVSGAGSLVNQGTITTGEGGNVYLVAPDVTNTGIITSPKGEVVLAAGKSVELVDPGTPNLRVAINAPDNAARNLGHIAADSGRIGIFAGLINHSGTIRADSAVAGDNGRILLKATKNTTLEAGSVVSANGPSGGMIEIQSGDTTLVSGTVEAKGTMGAGLSTEGRGGTVHILGNKVGLLDDARVDASGETGGGTVLVGGDVQGANPEVQNAYRTYVGSNTRIGVDAVTAGNGGKAIVWADDTTRYYGNISARGGSAGGDGGFVEVSGKNHLDFQGAVSTLAPFGRVGTLLLDPTDIEIVSSITGTATTLIGDLFQDTLSVATSQIEAANLETLLGSSNVTIKTQNLLGIGPLGGTVTFSANVIKPATGGATTLQVEAENNIIVSGGVTIGATDAANPLNVNFIANSDNSGAGGIKIGNGDQLSTIDTKGGNIVLGGTGTNPAIGDSDIHGVFVDVAALNAGTGAIVIRGQGNDTGGNGGNDGVVLRGSLLQTTSGNITIEGVGGRGDTINGHGVLIDSASKITSASGAIAITGTGASGGSSGFGRGVEILSGSVVESTGSATISITGTGGTSDGADDTGIFIADAGTRITSVDGAITLSGTGGSAAGGASNNSNTGISIALGAVVESTGAAAITMTGVGGDSPTSGDHGILVTTGGIVRTVNGNIDMTGTGGSASTGTGANDQGIVLGTAALVESTGAGAIKMAGTGGNSVGGAGGNVGVSMFGGAVVRSTSGAIDIQGTGRGTGSGNHGVKMDNATVASLGTAAIAMTGSVAGPGTGSGLEFALSSAGPNFTIGGASATGDITLIADSINMPHATVETTGTVFVRPLSTSRDIFLEAGASAGLSLSPAEIQNIDAGILQIGRSTDTGTLTVSTALNSGNVNAATLKLAHQNIVINEALTFSTDNENLFLTASGTIVEAGNGAIATGGSTMLNAGGAITLGGANDFSQVRVDSGTNVALTDVNAVVLNGINASGAFNLTAGGAITQLAPITVTGASSFNAGANSITLPDVNNDFGGAVSLNNSGTSNASITDSGSLTLGTSSIGGNLVANAGVDINVSGAIAVGGSATLTAGNDMSFDAALTVANALTLKATNSVLVSAAAVKAGGAVDVSAGLLDISGAGSSALLEAGGNIKMALGDLKVHGGVASAELRAGPGTFDLTTTGDVVVSGGTGNGAYARIFGNPDVTLKVGGAIKMTAGSGAGAFAAIEAVSPASINVFFPNVATGGYFVNGVEGAVYDAATLSGFIAGGLPAVLGQNLNVTYGLMLPPPPPVSPPQTEAVTTPLLSAQVASVEQTQELPSALEQLVRDVTRTASTLNNDDKKETLRLCN